MKKFKALFLVTIFVLATILLNTSAIAESAVRADEIARAKISSELLEVMAESSKDDLIPVYLWLKEIDYGIIASALIEEKGMDPAVYKDTDRFYGEIVPPIEAEVVARVGYDAAYYKEIPPELSKDATNNVRLSEPPNIPALSEYAFEYEDIAEFDWSMSLVDRAVHMKADEFLMAWRGIVKREYSSLNDTFIAKHIGNKPREIIYNSRYTSTIVVEANKAEILSYAKMSIVEDISLFVETIQEPDLSEVLEQIHADRGLFGTKGSSFNSGQGYRGTGIRIGIIEPNRQEFVRNTPMLSGIGTARLVFANDAGPGGIPLIPLNADQEHATMVTSLIVGQSVTVSGRTYEGIVPLAIVFQTPIETDVDVHRAIQNLVNRGAHVINYSGGNRNPETGYESHDREVDRLINSTFVVFVNSAGNYHSTWNSHGRVTSPGKALNAITVGNAATKSSNNATAPTPYWMYDGENIMKDGASAFNHVSTIPNKPDISAPGTNIGYVRSNNNVIHRTGTSYAAPFVTGVVAQMMQARADLRFNPHIVKSILIAGAFSVLIQRPPNDSANTLVSNSNHIWTKSGAGLVNARQSVLIAEANRYRDHRFINMSNWSVSLGNLSAGQRIRVVATFLRSNNSTISTALDYDNIHIRVLNSSGGTVASSTSNVQNVEIVEFNVSSNGSYSISVTPIRIRHQWPGGPGLIASVSWRTV
jgi:hypothetical protein